MIARGVGFLIMLTVLAACTGPPAPSVGLSSITPEDDGYLRLAFSTDRLTRLEAQEVLLLAAASAARKEGHNFFQFREVSAEGTADEITEEVRFFDVVATIDPLTDGERGDPRRKTYRVDGVIEFLGPRYRPILPPDILELLTRTNVT